MFLLSLTIFICCVEYYLNIFFVTSFLKQALPILLVYSLYTFSLQFILSVLFAKQYNDGSICLLKCPMYNIDLVCVEVGNILQINILQHFLQQVSGSVHFHGMGCLKLRPSRKSTYDDQGFFLYFWLVLGFSYFFISWLTFPL